MADKRSGSSTQTRWWPPRRAWWLSALCTLPPDSVNWCSEAPSPPSWAPLQGWVSSVFVCVCVCVFKSLDMHRTRKDYQAVKTNLWYLSSDHPSIWIPQASQLSEPRDLPDTAGFGHRLPLQQDCPGGAQRPRTTSNYTGHPTCPLHPQTEWWHQGFWKVRLLLLLFLLCLPRWCCICRRDCWPTDLIGWTACAMANSFELKMLPP